MVEKIDSTPAHVKATIDEAKKEEKPKRDSAELLKGLVQHPGWKIFTTMIEDLGNEAMQTVMAPCKTSDATLASEFAKGTFYACETLMGRLHGKMNEFKQEEEESGEAPPLTPPPTSERF